jgi:hypothetical protein
VSDEGAARMLLELHLPFVVLDEHADWDGFKVVILPDGYQLNPHAEAKANRFLSAGGRILAAGSALVNASGEGFLIDPGATLIGRSPFDPDYLVATDLTPEVPVKTAIVIEKGAYEIEPTFGRVLIERKVPYFNRAWDHFCSHQHTPDSPELSSPAAILSDQIAYFAHNIFSHYRLRGQPLYRDFVRAALVHLFGGRLPVESSLPSVARLNVLDQVNKGRSILHLLYAPITLRAMYPLWGQPKPIEIIEELLPLHNSKIRFQIDRDVKSVVLEPQGIELEFHQADGAVEFMVKEFTGHQMLALNWN